LERYEDENHESRRLRLMMDASHIIHRRSLY
jgi:hypothetical protein